MRTQQEILDRLQNANYNFGVQKTELILFLNFINAIIYLDPSVVHDVQNNRREWQPLKDPVECIRSYLPIAYEDASKGKRLSVIRNMLKLKTWIWLDDEEFYKSIVDALDDYTNYGIAELDKIALHYSI